MKTFKKPEPGWDEFTTLQYWRPEFRGKIALPKSWNPVTGCPKIEKQGGCKTPGGDPYCYYQASCQRFKRKTYLDVHPEKFAELERMKKPRIIRCCTAGDPWAYCSDEDEAYFGSFTLDRLNEIDKAEEAVREMNELMYKHPQHLYLLLTHSPEKYYDNFFFKSSTDIKIHVGFGATATTVEEIENAAKHAKGDVLGFEWLIIEPCFLTTEEAESLPDDIFQGIDWLVIGALTGPYASKYQPTFMAIYELMKRAEKSNIPVFLKESVEWTYEETMRTTRAIRSSGRLYDRKEDAAYGQEWIHFPKLPPKQFPKAIIEWAINQ